MKRAALIALCAIAIVLWLVYSYLVWKAVIV